MVVVTRGGGVAVEVVAVVTCQFDDHVGRLWLCWLRAVGRADED